MSAFRDVLAHHWNDEGGHDDDLARLNRLIEGLASAIDVADVMSEDVPSAIWGVSVALTHFWERLVESVRVEESDPNEGLPHPLDGHDPIGAPPTGETHGP